MKMQEEQKKRTSAEQTVNILVSQHPIVARALGICRYGKLPETEALAMIHMRLACTPRIRSAQFVPESKAQAKSVTIVADALTVVVKRSVREMFGSLPVPQSIVDGPVQTFRVRGFCFGQWDETSQRARALQPRRQAMRVHAPVSAQIFVFCGRMASSVLSVQGGQTFGPVRKAKPFFRKERDDRPTDH